MPATLECPRLRPGLAVTPDRSTASYVPTGLALKDILERFEREAIPGTCDTGRYRCPYYTWGEGPPLLFIAGLSDDARSFVQVIARLSGHFRCTAFDLPSGRRDGARLRHYTHAGLVEDVFALLDHLGIRQSYVFGSSFGSTIALGALRRRPERLPRALLQSGFASRPLSRAERLMACVVRGWPGPLRSLPFREAMLRRENAHHFAGLPPEVWQHFLVRSNSHPLAAVVQRALMVHHLDLRSILADIRQPVLLVCGDNDRLVCRSCEETLLAGLPNARRVELLNCGHNPLFTHSEALAEVTRCFLTAPAEVGA
jgi:pimeloyl-ACP methyl ester carboxylesterase